MKLTEKDLHQLKNLIISFFEKKGYFPFFEDLIKEYSFIFPENIDNSTKDKIDNFVNEIIISSISSKTTKGGHIMSDILEKNNDLWKEFRKLNSIRFFDENKFQEIGKQVEILIMNGEDKLTSKLVGVNSMGISKVSESWYDMVYAIFPEWNKIK